MCQLQYWQQQDSIPASTLTPEPYSLLCNIITSKNPAVTTGYVNIFMWYMMQPFVNLWEYWIQKRAHQECQRSFIYISLVFVENFSNVDNKFVSTQNRILTEDMIKTFRLLKKQRLTSVMKFPWISCFLFFFYSFNVLWNLKVIVKYLTGKLVKVCLELLSQLLSLLHVL